MIVNISGFSGSGKTTLVSYLLEKYPYTYHKLISYTNRPKRLNEKDGVDYYFVNENFFNNKDNFILKRDRSDGFYAVKKEDIFSQNGKIMLMTFPPRGILKLEELGLSVMCFYLLVSIDECRKRMLKRGDDLINVESRLINDKKESTLEVIKDILTDKTIFVLDGFKTIDELGLTLHKLCLTNHGGI